MRGKEAVYVGFALEQAWLLAPPAPPKLTGLPTENSGEPFFIISIKSALQIYCAFFGEDVTHIVIIGEDGATFGMKARLLRPSWRTVATSASTRWHASTGTVLTTGAG